MKKILLAVVLLLCSPHVAMAQTANEWSVGDRALVRTICRDEPIIMDLVKYDIESVEKLINRTNFYIVQGLCMHIPVPISFKILKIIVEYKDSSGVDNVVLMAEDPRPTMRGSVAGYFIAIGRAKDPNNI